MIRRKSNSLITFAHVSLFKPYYQDFSNFTTRLSSSTPATRGHKKRRRKSKAPSSSSSSSKSLLLSKLPVPPQSTRRKPVAPLSTLLASPKLQQKLYDKFIDFRKNAQDAFKSHFESDGRFFTVREKRRIEMDAQWWTWNLMLACTPGFFLFLVCQYYKGEMEEFYLRQKMIERRKQGLEDNDDDAADVNVLSSESESHGNRNIWDIQRKQSSLWDDLVHLFEFGSRVGEENDANSASDPTEYSKKLEVEKNIHEKKDHLPEHEQEPSIQVLLERILALEARLDAQNEMIQKKKHSMPYSYPSSIRDRNEARLRELSDNEDLRQVQETRWKLLEILKTASWSNLKSKGDAILNAGQGLLVDIQRVFQMEDTESLKRNASETLHEESESKDAHALSLISSSSSEKESNDNESMEDTRDEHIVIPDLFLEEQNNDSSPKQWWKKLLRFARNNENNGQPDN